MGVSLRQQACLTSCLLLLGSDLIVFSEQRGTAGERLVQFSRWGDGVKGTGHSLVLPRGIPSRA